MSATVVVKVPYLDRHSNSLLDRFYSVILETLAEAEQQAVAALTTRMPSPAQFIAARPFMSLSSGDNTLFVPSGNSYTFVTVPDYFEDEDGRPLSPIDLIEAMSGVKEPILLNDERSILRLGPQGVRTGQPLDTASANTVAHFLQLVEVIAASRWVKSEARVGSIGCPTAGSDLVEFTCPTLSDTFAILLPLRQLFCEDGKSAFPLACKAYERYTLDERKRFWMAEMRKRCQTYLQSRAWPPLSPVCTVHELLKALMYGAGMVHFHKSTLEERERFRNLVQQHTREWVVFSFVSASQQLYAYARKAYHVIRQDFDHWRSEGWCPDPDIMLMSQLFDSRPVA